jgi:hypothetical protein
MTSTDPPGVEPTSGSADVGNARADASTMTETMGTASSLPSSSDDPSQMDSGAAEESNADVPSNKKQDEAETATDATMESEKPSDEAQNNGIQVVVAPSSGIIISSSKKSRPPYKYDPEKITLRFLFANRDGLTVTVECKPSDTVGEVKGALISVWPKGTFQEIYTIERLL